MKNYTEFPGLAHVYLEDSFVLDIQHVGSTFTFTLDAVLTQDHPRYHPARPGEQHCYADAQLVFRDVDHVEWVERSHQVYTDANDETDLGNIDTLTYNGEYYDIAGDWGQVRIYTSASPSLDLK